MGLLSRTNAKHSVGIIDTYFTYIAA